MRYNVIFVGSNDFAELVHGDVLSHAGKSSLNDAPHLLN